MNALTSPQTNSGEYLLNDASDCNGEVGSSLITLPGVARIVKIGNTKYIFVFFVCYCRDLSEQGELQSVILESFSSHNEEVKSAASYALGKYTQIEPG